MHPVHRFLLAVLALSTLGMAHKDYAVTVRFFVEANKSDTDHFATPIKLTNPPRETFIEKIPAVHERSVKAIYPFTAADGTNGCSFILDETGRLDLSVISHQRRGASMVVFIGTKQATHQVLDMVIDRGVNDGIITIQRGITDLEMLALRKQWPVIPPHRK